MVQRYEFVVFEGQDGNRGELVSNNRGDYVEYSDYEDLEYKTKEAIKTLEDVTKELKEAIR